MEWISVKDKLPKRDALHDVSSPVLVYNGGYRQVAFRGTDDKWYLNGEFSEVYGVTHWMPLPEPPVQNQSQTETNSKTG